MIWILAFTILCCAMQYRELSMPWGSFVGLGRVGPTNLLWSRVGVLSFFQVSRSQLSPESCQGLTYIPLACLVILPPRPVAMPRLVNIWARSWNWEGEEMWRDVVKFKGVLAFRNKLVEGMRWCWVKCLETFWRPSFSFLRQKRVQPRSVAWTPKMMISIFFFSQVFQARNYLVSSGKRRRPQRPAVTYTLSHWSGSQGTALFESFST